MGAPAMASTREYPFMVKRGRATRSANRSLSPAVPVIGTFRGYTKPQTATTLTGHITGKPSECT
jgi:hypothetical protein